MYFIAMWTNTSQRMSREGGLKSHNDDSVHPLPIQLVPPALP